MSSDDEREDRVERYRHCPLEECSEPELWMNMHHFDDDWIASSDDSGAANHRRAEEYARYVGEDGEYPEEPDTSAGIPALNDEARPEMPSSSEGTSGLPSMPAAVGSLVVRSNPEISVKVEYRCLGLPTISVHFHDLRDTILEGEVDDLKKKVQDHIQRAHSNFKILRRHFQLEVFVDHCNEWRRVSYNSIVREELNLHQIGLRNTEYLFRIVLNPGQTRETCGLAWT